MTALFIILGLGAFAVSIAVLATFAHLVIARSGAVDCLPDWEDCL